MRNHVVHLCRGHAELFDSNTQHVNDLTNGAEPSQIVGVAFGVLIGTAIIGVDSHDQSRHLCGTDGHGGNTTCFEITLHCSNLVETAG